MTAAFAVTARRIFDGSRMHADSALVVEDGKIRAITSSRTCRPACRDPGRRWL